MEKDKREYLPNEIFEIPEIMDTMAFDYIRQEIGHLDDERMAIYNRWLDLSKILIILCVVFAFLVTFIIIFKLLVLAIIVCTVYGLSIALIFNIEYSSYDKYLYKCEFDRLNGTVIYPTLILRKGKIKFQEVRFSDLKFALNPYSLSIWDPRNKKQIISFKVKKAEVADETEAREHLLRLHSFLQWYMDKNRPLPPGKIFDEFRWGDYATRLIEGFKKSTIPSLVDMTEFDGKPYKGEKKIKL